MFLAAVILLSFSLDINYVMYITQSFNKNIIFTVKHT